MKAFAIGLVTFVVIALGLSSYISWGKDALLTSVAMSFCCIWLTAMIKVSRPER